MTGFTPFEIADPLPDQDAPEGSTIGAERLRLAEGLMLSAAHFETEQLYHRSRQSRMLAFLHGAGTVAGLNVTYEMAVPEDEDATPILEVQVSPGLAVDLRGRLIELRFKSCVALADWMAEQSAGGDTQALLQQAARAGGGGLPSHVAVDVTAHFATYAHRPEPAFATGNADRIDSVEPSLSVDSCRLSLDLRDAAHTLTAEAEISVAHEGANANEDTLHRLKREALWDVITRPEGTGLHLARLRVPIVTAGNGTVSFDDSFDMSSAPVAPDFTFRRYSYSAAELALLSGLRR